MSVVADAVRQGLGADQRASREYRADIDGLRALAVLPIVIFHLGVKTVSGGFVGVDIFFVISGYLIGGPLLAQVFENKYSLGEFYARRFKRILPALFVMLMATTVAMAFVALPIPLIDYAKSLLAAMFSVSNVFFWQSAGYFDSAAESKPLLHTWSLGVEEQFYLLFPLLVLASRNAGRRAVLTILSLTAAASFLIGAWGVTAAPVATFYLLHTRVWEMLLGVIASQIPVGVLARRWLREGLSIVALGAIIVPIFVYTSATPFPGVAAAAPCLGTAVLLATGAQGGSWVGRFFALPPLVFFGLISYSLYLWHWPVIVLLREGLPATNLGAGLQVIALTASIGLAWLSWRFIERPLRSPLIDRKQTFRWTLTAAGAVGVIGGALLLLGGLPERLPADSVRFASYLDYPNVTRHPNSACWVGPKHTFDDYDAPACLRVQPGSRNVLLFGDSHAAHLRSGLDADYPALHVREASASGCTPLVVSRPGRQPACQQLLKYMFGRYLPQHRGEWIILAARWRRGDLPAAMQTVDWLRARGLNVVVVGPVVRYRIPLSQLLALAAWRKDPALVDRFRDRGIADLDAAYAQMAARHGATYVSAYRTFCPNGGVRCASLAADGAPLQWDDAHLTYEGSLLVARRVPVAEFPSAPR